MATIAENIQTLRSIKSDIKNAIIQKGGSVTDAFGTYAQAITNLPSGGGGTEMEDALITRTISGTYYNSRVSMVGDYAFNNLISLTSIDLPNCTSVSNSGFGWCSKLASVSLPLCKIIGRYCFQNCTTLLSLDLPNCTFVDYGGFQSCYSLQYINLPNCSYVSNNGFDGCSKLISIDLSLCNYITFGLFSKCLKLTYVSIPLCKRIEGYGFSSCHTLPSINFPNCTLVEYSAFYHCSALSIVKLPNCSYFGNNTFYSCTNLAQVYLNSVSSVTSIQSTTFSNCPNLTSVYVPASLVDAFKTAQYWSSISDKIVAYTEPTEPTKYPPLIYSTNAAGSTITVNGQSVTLEHGDNITLDYPNEITSVKATGNTALTYIQIPNTVTSIENNAFADCDALSEIILPDSLTSIGDMAFEFCIGLKSANIPSGVTSIRGTFNACSALTSVTLPDTLQTIGDSAFMECTSLTSITIPSSVTMIESCAFDYCEALTDFNFNGTKAQWGAITLADDWKNNAAFTVVHCTDGDVNIL